MMNRKVEVSRRSLIKWSAPVVVSVSLPVHAMGSVCAAAEPVVVITSSPKCAGDPPIGQAAAEITSSLSGCSIEITALTASDADSVITATLPATVDDVTPLEFTWEGPASDAITCLPITQIDLAIEFTEPNTGISSTITVDLSTLLINSL